MFDIYGRLKEGAAVTLRSDATLTASFVTTSSVDLFSFGNVNLIYSVGTAQSGTQAEIKHQWSDDGTNWCNQLALSATSTSSSYTYYAGNSKVTAIPLTPSGAYMESLDRLGRYYRAECKGDVSTSGTFSLLVRPANTL